MRIGVDGTLWGQRRGPGRFTRELVLAMTEAGPEHEYVLFLDRRTADAAVVPRGVTTEVVARRHGGGNGAGSLADRWKMTRAASRCGLDVYLFPSEATFFPLLGRVPTVVTFHDALGHERPELVFANAKARRGYHKRCRLALKKASLLWTVSETARADIGRAFSYPAGQIRVIAQGPASAFRPMDDPADIRPVLEHYGLPLNVPLLLYMGGISPHKNLEGLLEALSLVKTASHVGWHLVIAGDLTQDAFHGCYEELLNLSRELDWSSQVTFTGFVPDRDLAVLYNAATMLVMPSLAEGFGLPAVEAMASGLPVAASRRGALPEVLGNAAFLFDPEDREDMARAIIRLLEDAGQRLFLKEQGLRRVADFSWRAAAASALASLRSIVKARGRASTV